MDRQSPGDIDHLPGDRGSDPGVGADALTQLKRNAPHHIPRFALVFVGAVLGALLTVGGLAIWWKHYQDDQTAKDAREAAEVVLRDCRSRAESGAQIQATAQAAVAHAEDTARLMGSIRDVLASTSSTSPAVVKIRDEIDVYVTSVAHFRDVAAQYQPTTVDECIARSKNPTSGG